MAYTLKEFLKSVSKYVALGNLEETPLSQEQLDMFDIDNQTDKKQNENNLSDIDNMLNKLEHKNKDISHDEKSIKSPDFDETNLKDNEKNLS